MSTLATHMAECIALKKGDKEFTLTHFEEEWRAGIGDPSGRANISDYTFTGGWCPNPEQAVDELLTLLKQHGGQVPAGQRSTTL